jgi:hypothetical protein
MPNGGPQQDPFLTGVDRLGFKLVGGLARIFGSLASHDEETYWLPITSTNGQGFVNLNAVVGDRQSATMQVTQEADLVVTRFLHQEVAPDTGVVINGSYTVTATDGATDRTLMIAPVHINTFAGNAQLSVPFTKNRLFRRNTTISFNFVNLQAVATQVWLIAQGYKVFDQASLDLVRRR